MMAMSDDDLDFYSGGGVSFAPVGKRSEIFIMNTPHTDPNIVGWRTLKEAIKQAGGEVVEGPPQMLSGSGDLKRSSLYTRDTGVHLSVGDREFFLYADPNNERSRAVLRGEIGEVVKLLQQPQFGKLTKIPVPADVEGGNLVYSPAQRTLFVGQTKHDFGLYLAEAYTPLINTSIEQLRTMPEHKDHLPLLELLNKFKQGAPLDAREQQWMRDAEAHYDKPQAESLEALKQTIDTLNQALVKEKVIPNLEAGIKVQPIEIPREKSFPSHGLPDSLKGRNFYHLDNVLNALPGGQLVLCPSAIGKGSLAALKPYPHYDITEEAAAQGAANFITVRDTVITPHLPNVGRDKREPSMREWLQNQGYSKIVTPESYPNLLPNSWRFCDGGFVRCATQKVTPDLGFPELGQATGAVRK